MHELIESTEIMSSSCLVTSLSTQLIRHTSSLCNRYSLFALYLTAKTNTNNHYKYASLWIYLILNIWLYAHYYTTMHHEFGIWGGQSVEIQVFLWTVSTPQGSWAQTFREWGDNELRWSKNSHFLFLQEVWDLEVVLGLAVAIFLGLWGLAMIAGFTLLLSTWPGNYCWYNALCTHKVNISWFISLVFCG